MRTRKLRKPAAVAASLALLFAMSACDTDNPTDGTTGTTSPGLGSTTTFVDATTTTIADAATTTTAAG